MDGRILIAAGVLLVASAVSAVLPPFGENHTRVVREVEAAGAGNLDHISLSDMMFWFRKHPQVAQRIAPQCIDIARTANARWNSSLEGRVCRAAIPVSAKDTLITGHVFTATN